MPEKQNKEDLVYYTQMAIKHLDVAIKEMNLHPDTFQHLVDLDNPEPLDIPEDYSDVFRNLVRAYRFVKLSFIMACAKASKKEQENG